MAGGPGPNSVETGLRFAGHCLVDGFALVITADLRFTDQPLHESKGASADAEAARLGVVKIKALATPAANPTLAVYLDAWERVVTPAEDASLVLAAIGTESCARIKREWAVRVRDGVTAPQPGDLDSVAGHGYLLLGTLARVAAQANINSADVTDRRLARLSLADMVTRVGTIERLALQPAFGPNGNQFAPMTGPVGNKINLMGRNFNLGTVTVSFDTIATTVIGIPTASTITTVVPATLALGKHKITVTTEGGTTTSLDDFNVIPAI